MDFHLRIHSYEAEIYYAYSSIVWISNIIWTAAVFSCNNGDGMYGSASRWESSVYTYDAERLAYLLASVIISCIYFINKKECRKKLLNACMKRFLGCWFLFLTFKQFTSYLISLGNWELQVFHWFWCSSLDPTPCDYNTDLNGPLIYICIWVTVPFFK